MIEQHPSIGTGSNHSAYLGRSANKSLPSIVSSHGKTLVDQTGKRYDDLISGAMVANFGYTNPTISSILSSFSENLPYLHGRNLTSLPTERLSEMLASSWKDNSMVSFGVTGSDGIELALRICWLYHLASGDRSRTRTVNVSMSYHGSTFGSLSNSNFAGGTLYDDLRRNVLTLQLCVLERQGQKLVGLSEVSSRQLRDDAFSSYSAVVLEPIIANAAGTLRFDIESLKEIRSACDRHGVLLIYDQIATSMGRCGALFNDDPSMPQPDLSVVSKGLTVGYYPLSAVLVSERIHLVINGSQFHSLLGHTFSCQPVACEIAFNVLGTVREPSFLSEIRRKGTRIREILLQSDLFKDVRAEGLLVSADFSAPNINAGILNAKLLASGIVALFGTRSSNGVSTTFITLAPYFHITDEEIATSIIALIDAIKLNFIHCR